MKRIRAIHIAKAFVTHWVTKYGPPRVLLSDNGPQLTAKVFQTACQILGTKNVYTCTYHSQTNRQVERYNRTILQMLRHYVHDHQQDWDLFSETLTYAYNTQVHRSTGVSPLELVLTSSLRHFAVQSKVEEREPPDAFDKNDFIVRLDETLRQASQRLHAGQERYKRAYDRTVRLGNANLATDDLVFVRDEDSDESKLSFKTLGSFRVIVNNGNTITVDYDGVHQRINSDRVTPVPKPDVTVKPNASSRASAPPALADSREPSPARSEFADKDGENSPYSASQPHSGSENDAPMEYVIDKVVDHCTTANGKEFLVKWYGYHDLTWEPKSRIPPALTSAYLRKLNIQPLGFENSTAAPRTRRRISPGAHDPAPLRRSSRLLSKRG